MIQLSIKNNILKTNLLIFKKFIDTNEFFSLERDKLVH